MSQVARNLRSSRDKMGFSRENKGYLISLYRGPPVLKGVRSGGLSSLGKNNSEVDQMFLVDYKPVDR